jgi:hypothetical protein
LCSVWSVVRNLVTQTTWVLPSLKDPKPPYMSSLPPAARNSGISLQIISKLVAPSSSHTYSLMALKIKSKRRTESVRKEIYVWFGPWKTIQPSQEYIYTNLSVQRFWSWTDDLRGCSVLPNPSLPSSAYLTQHCSSEPRNPHTSTGYILKNGSMQTDVSIIF